ncbi:hypothetical protein KUCAC02_027337, partial [Chaenocephalus aceratus]
VQSAVVHSARQQWSGCANAAISGAGKPGKPAYQEAGCTEQWVGVVAFRDESVEAPLRREAEGGEP